MDDIEIEKSNYAYDADRNGKRKACGFSESFGWRGSHLVTGDPMTVGGKTYIPAPVLVEAGGAAAEADIKCDIEEPENPTNPTEPTNPTDPSNPTSPTRYYDDSDDDDWIRLRIRSRLSQQRLTRR